MLIYGINGCEEEEEKYSSGEVEKKKLSGVSLHEGL